MKNDPLNRVDPLGLYDELIHYYMTYFLAVVAGIPKDQALTISLATQYIDDNSGTSPLTPLGLANGSLTKYHFTLDYNSGFHGDSTDDILTRFRNPNSAQLDNLYSAYTRSQGSCRRSLFFGEYLHAFEDTFTHRDSNNKPYDLFNLFDNSPAGLIGHAVTPGGGHAPDHSYNQLYITTTTIDTEFTGDPVTVTTKIPFSYKELRTLEIEQEVFQKMQNFAGNGFYDREDLAGDGDATIGIAGETGYQSVSGITGVLQKYNAFNENIDTFQGVSGIEGKILILRQWLVANGLVDSVDTAIPDYNEAKGAENRYNYQHGLNPRDYSDVILTNPCHNSRRGPDPKC